MAKRPTAPRPRSIPRRPASAPKPAASTDRSTTPRSKPATAKPATAKPAAAKPDAAKPASKQPAPTTSTASQPTAPKKPAAGKPAAATTSAASKPAQRQRSGGRSVGRPAEHPPALPAPGGRELAESPSAGPDRGRVVQATERFRSLVAGRPWRRRRRAILGSLLAAVLVLGAALSAGIWLPALQLQQVTVSGLGYVEEEPVRSLAETRTGDSVLLLPTSTMEQELTRVPGVSSAEVDRDWPDGVHITVTESVPAATLARPDGSTAVIDEGGAELPAAAGEGAALIPLTVDPGSSDPDGATEAMVEVLNGLPEPLRGAVTDITAASRSDVTLNLSLEDGGSKTVVWGDAQDAELKAEVVQTLIEQPGEEIDVSSPVAPVTR